MTQRTALVLVLVGIVTLLHAGFSEKQYRGYLRLSEAVDVEDEPVALDIALQCCIGFLMAAIGVIIATGPPKEIAIERQLEKMSFHKLNGRRSFMTFGHLAGRQ